MLMLVFSANAADGRTLPSKEEVARRMELSREIKEYEKRLGWKPTTNFERYDEGLATYDYCGWSGKFDFDISWSQVTEKECSAVGQEHDTAFYQFEALATISTPLSRSMVEADLPRFIMVVFHEDFHEQSPEVPSRAIDESATQLMGLLAAREFAREKYGAESEIHRFLAADVETALLTSQIESVYYEKLKSLYAQVSSGEVDRADGLKQKARLFENMQNECKRMILATATSCAFVTNNAIFANSIDYSAHYPIFYNLSACLGGDVRQTGLAIMQLANEKLDEEEFIRRVNAVIASDCR
ncbi:MAG: aminopeptidase [bacterium]|nr:aminopeptidase [bacterium]